jgi:hypothetical protein
LSAGLGGGWARGAPKIAGKGDLGVPSGTMALSGGVARHPMGEGEPGEHEWGAGPREVNERGAGELCEHEWGWWFIN